jgi:hypothetical protein
VDEGRWLGLAAELPEALVVDGRPPEELVAEVRETQSVGRDEPGQGLSRVRLVRCTLVEQVGADLFYVPVPDQHSGDEPWDDARRAVLRLRPLPTFRPARQRGGRA